MRQGEGDAIKRYGYLGVLLLIGVVLAGCAGSTLYEGDLRGFVFVPSDLHVLSESAELEPMFSSQALPPQGYKPAVGITVRAYNERTGTTRYSYTDKYGGFLFRSLPEGYYRVTVNEGQLRYGTANSRVYVYRNQENWIQGPILGGFGYYVIIGIDKYPGKEVIPGAAENARKVFDYLYDRNQLAADGRLLINGDEHGYFSADKDTIEAYIRDAGEYADRSDYLVIYFSGISGKDFLSPADDPGDGDWDKAITDADLERWTGEFPGSVTLIVDGTQSYTMADGHEFDTQALMGPKYTVISADNRDDRGVFYDDRIDSSVFTHFLIEGISGPSYLADKNRDGDITASELYNYIYAQMYDYLYLEKDPDWHLPGFWPGDYGDSVIFRY